MNALPYIAPYVAPLSISMTRKVLKDMTYKPTLDLAEFLDNWKTLHLQVKEARPVAYELVKEAFEDNKLTTQWIIKELGKLAPQHTTYSNETILRWREEGLLPYRAYNAPQPERTVAMLIMRKVNGAKKQAWLPSTKDPQFFHQEAKWWCWRQDSLNAPLVPCPVPLPESLPGSALLWTSWFGASSFEDDTGWQRIGNLGCARWAKRSTLYGQSIWSLSEGDLMAWGIAISPEFKDALDECAPLMRHTLAEMALVRLGTTRLKEAQSFPVSLIDPHLSPLLTSI